MDEWTRLAMAAGAAALLALLLWVLRRRHSLSLRWAGRGAVRGRPLAREDRLLLTPHHSVHLLRVGGRALIVAAFAGGCSVLDSFPWEELHGAGKENRR